MTLQDKRIGFIGGGHITEIIVENLIRTRTADPGRMVVSDPNKGRLDFLCARYALEGTTDNSDAFGRGDYLFINVLPQNVGAVIEELKRSSPLPGKVLISLAAGIPIEKYRVLGETLAVVRALPNPPSQIGQGIVAVAFNSHVTAAQREDILTLFSSLGPVAELDESKINTVTALSSPVITLQFFQSLVEAGVRCGIDRKTSSRIVYQTIIGSLELWKARSVSPSVLIEEASTPAGISVEALFALDRHGFSAALKEAIEQGMRRAAELGDSLSS